MYIHNLRVASVTRVLKRMVDLKVVYTYGKQHKFASPFFRLWLLDAVGAQFCCG